MSERTCARCGETFEGYKSVRHCPICKPIVKREQNQRYNAKRQNDLKTIGYAHKCEYCGKSYRSKRETQRFCSRSCRSSFTTRPGPTPAQLARRRALLDECARANDAANGQPTVIHRNGRVIEIRGQVPGRRY